ncbi:MAG: hypothetical protein U0K18_06390 [Acutalibacteraceae bacterium]|nr:hypothetical protein [Acutalibacteraceae bacterium]
MNESSLPKKTKLLWQIRIAAIGFIPIAVMFALSSVSLWFTAAGAVFVALFAAAVFWYVPAFYESYSVSFSNGAIIVNRGVIIKTCHIMPFSRLVYVQSISTPLAKTMGLSALSLKAARSSVLIPELAAADTQRFINAVTGKEP